MTSTIATTIQPPAPKRRTFNPTSSFTSNARLFTRTSSEQAGEKYGIEEEVTWKVHGVAARIRQNVSTGYQTTPVPPPQLPTLIRTISGNPVQDHDFQEPEFLNPSLRSHSGRSGEGEGEVEGSDEEGREGGEGVSGLSSGSGSGSGLGSGSSLESVEMGVAPGSGSGFFGPPRSGLVEKRAFGRHTSVPAHLYPHAHAHAHQDQAHHHGHLSSTSPSGEIFEPHHNLLSRAEWQAERSRLDELVKVRALRGRRGGELGGYGEVWQPEEDGLESRGVEEGASGLKRGVKRVGGGSGMIKPGAGTGDDHEDEGMGSETDTEMDGQGPSARDHDHIHEQDEFGIPSFIRFDRYSRDDSHSNSSGKGTFRGSTGSSQRELRPTKSLPARVFGMGMGMGMGTTLHSESSTTTAAAGATMGGLVPLNPTQGPIAAPFTSGFFTPSSSSIVFHPSASQYVAQRDGGGMQVDSVPEEQGEEDGFAMDEAFGDEAGDVFGKTL